MATRNIMRIDLTGPAKKEVGKISDRYGMTQLTIMSRLVDWFGKQSDGTRASICSMQDGKESRATVKKLLEEMIAKK